MAESEATLLIRLKDEVSSGLGSIKASTLAVVAAFASLASFTANLVKSALESEEATSKLNIALKNQGIYSKELSGEMLAYSSQLQKTSTFSDEAITRTQAMLTTFGLAGSQMKTTTKAVLDLSAGMGIDLNTAAMLIGKAFQGQTETLGRYGIKIDQTIPVTEKFDAVLQQLNSRFGGAAQAATETMSGKMAVLSNQFDDLKEGMGTALFPVLDRYLGYINTIIQAMNQWGGVFNSLKILGLEFSKYLIEGVMISIEQIPILGTIFNNLGFDIQGVNDKINQQIAALNNATNQGISASSKNLLDKKIKTEQAIAIEKRLTDEAAKQAAKREADAKKEVENKTKLEIDSIQRRREADATAQQAKQQNFVNTLNFISSLSTAKNKELAAIGKAAGIASATIDTYAAANKALASAPPPWNFALAAAVVTAGLVNVAKIAGVQMAQGGLVMPTAGGTIATLGEGGKSELVLPLDDDRTKRKLSESGIGSSTINLNVGILVGSENNVRELARMIDQELFTLRRNNESVAFEAL